MFHRLSIKQLETFYWAARLDSFSAAAARLNTTQPSISIRIRGMEQILRVSLFDRGFRRPRLTPKGRELAAQVERIIALGEEFDELLGWRDTIGGLVRVGAADTVALTWLPALMAKLAQSYPGISVDLVVDLSVNLRLRLDNGELDVAFLVGGPSRQAFETWPLGQVEQRWMAAPKLGLSGRALRGRHLTAWPIFTHSRGSDHYHSVRRWFDAERARPDRMHGCNSLATMVAMTKAGLGLSVLPPAMLAHELEEGTLMVLHTHRPIGPYAFVATHLAQPPRRAVTAVAELARRAAAASPVFAGR
jgi:DNA-binding transcriptional LysR family regulator